MLAAALLALALVLGGGGSPAPLPELVLELISALMLALWLGGPGAHHLPSVPRGTAVIVTLVVMLPAIQLVPLPPFVWQAMPGRELEQASLALVGAEDSWRSWSLAPSRTLASLLSLLPPLALLAITSCIDRTGRVLLLKVVVGVAVLALLLGTLQLSSGNASPFQLYGAVDARMAGFQANHNSTADFLLVAMLAVPALVRSQAGRRLPDRPGAILAVAGGGMILFGFGVLLTASRMGIAILPIPIIVGGWMLRRRIPLSRRSLVLRLFGVALAGLLALAMVRSNPVLATIIARFDFGQELRPQLWQDGLYVARKYFPFGVGLGNFVPALLADERLEVVRPFLPNRAHNDYLELAAEAGLFGLAVLAACSWLLLRSAWKRLRDPQLAEDATQLFAVAAIGVFALHSMVDYPFRSMAMACLGAVCAGFLLAPRSAGSSGDGSGSQLAE